MCIYGLSRSLGRLGRWGVLGRFLKSSLRETLL